MARTRRSRHRVSASADATGSLASPGRGPAGVGNAARADRLGGVPGAAEEAPLLWADGASASLDAASLDASGLEGPGLLGPDPEAPAAGMEAPPVTQISLAFHVTRPADATDQNVVQAGAPLSDAARYVEVDSGRRLWLDLSSLDSSERQALDVQLARAGGAVRVDRRTGQLVIGEGWREQTLEADTRPARAVLDDANARGAEWGAAGAWGWLNGGSGALESSEADRTGFVSGQTKPGAWYNHYFQSPDGTVHAHTSGHDRSGTDAPALDEAGLRRLVMDCLDVNGVRAALGSDVERFRAGLQQRFAEGHPLGASGLDWLIDELWSHLQTGAGTDGAVDIGRLQAIARALGADTAESAETNTRFGSQGFAVGDTGASLERGDGHFGRATMLSLMHLVGSIHEAVVEPLTVRMVPAGAFHDEDRFLVDGSGSMVGGTSSAGKWGPVSSAVSETMGWSEAELMERKVGDLYERRMVIGGEKAMDLGEALERAYRLLHPEDTRDDRAAFAALFGLRTRDVFSEAGLEVDRLRSEIGDGTSTRAREGYGAPGESGLKGFLMVLTHPELLPEGDPLRQQLEGGSRAPGAKGARLNAVVDEPEQSLEYLAVVQALASTLEVDVRFIATPKSARLGSSASQLQLIDIEDIAIDGDGVATVRFTQAGIEHTREVEVDGHAAYSIGGAFEDAVLPLHEKQEIVGVTQ